LSGDGSLDPLKFFLLGISPISIFRGQHLENYHPKPMIEPYKEVLNRLISMINEDAYKRKERLVEAICRLIKTQTTEACKNKRWR
jgi:hypothetical protein